MNLPTQLTCLPRVAASCLPIETRSILSPLITTVAFGSTLPSAGLITVAPASEIFSAYVAVAIERMQRMTERRAFIAKHQTSYVKHPLFLRFRDRFLSCFETDFRMRAVAKRFFR